jgi:hypothetical protein
VRIGSKNPRSGMDLFLPDSGQLGATVSGIDEQEMLSRALEQILAKLESAELNSLEIMRVATGTSKHFLGVRYVTLSAQSRHIQASTPAFREPRTLRRATDAQKLTSQKCAEIRSHQDVLQTIPLT